MGTVLDDIVEQTARDLAKRRRRISFRDLSSLEDYERERRDFAGALREEGRVSVIAEIKKASPSKGVIRPDFDPQAIARAYRRGGASVLSVLTDEPAFQGRLEYLSAASRAARLPALRKDFIIDPYQVREARAWGADAVLFIVGITEGRQLEELLHAAAEEGLACLVECYTEEELKRVPWELVSVLGVNNRDLHTFEVDLHRGVALLQSAPKDTLLVSESGLGTPEDLKLLHREGIHAALIGEHFMRRDDPGQAVRELLRGAFPPDSGEGEEE
ncbi:MAG: indole-3-glycerol phosphate synthase TrpC [Balneolaceae bacterium]|nr:indole-3-glycerol phosphate synthase TrpC [Balneolaceae bacterium]